MNISFTREEMREFLHKRKIFTVSGKKYATISRPSNYRETFEVETIFIYKDGEQYMPHLFDGERPYQWLEMVFEEEMKKVLLKL